MLDRIPDAYHVTLDGNEQFADAEAAASLWSAVAGDARLARLVLRRSSSSSRSSDRGRFGIPSMPSPGIALSSSTNRMANLTRFPRARSVGYAGISSKGCKGLYKSILNAARCEAWQGTGGAAPFMSAEDLTTQAGLSVQQDLALASLLGMTHVERKRTPFHRRV